MVAGVPPQARTVTIEDVADAVTRYYGITLDNLIEDNRTARLVRPRHVFMYLSRELTLARLSEVGDYIKRDHSTVYNGWNTVRLARPNDEELKYEIGVISAAIMTAVGYGPPEEVQSPPKLKFYDECEVEIGRYMFDIADMPRILRAQGIPRGAWAVNTYVTGNKIRYTFRWSKDDDCAEG